MYFTVAHVRVPTTSKATATPSGEVVAVLAHEARQAVRMAMAMVFILLVG
jgi:hypothetical protein